MLNHLATVIACGKTNGRTGTRAVQMGSRSTPGSNRSPADRRMWSHAVSVRSLLNADYTKYMCCSTAAGYVVPSPGITFKGSLTIRYGVKGDS